MPKCTRQKYRPEFWMNETAWQSAWPALFRNYTDNAESERERERQERIIQRLQFKLLPCCWWLLVRIAVTGRKHNASTPTPLLPQLAALPPRQYLQVKQATAVETSNWCYFVTNTRVHHIEGTRMRRHVPFLHQMNLKWSKNVKLIN